MSGQNFLHLGILKPQSISKNKGTIRGSPGEPLNYQAGTYNHMQAGCGSCLSLLQVDVTVITR